MTPHAPRSRPPQPPAAASPPVPPPASRRPPSPGGARRRRTATVPALAAAALLAGLVTAPPAASSGASPVGSSPSAPSASGSSSAADPAARAARPGETGVRIHDIQGRTRLSPYAGKSVRDVPGVVTGVRARGSSRGFWFQDPHPDRSAATSEGLFVYTGRRTPKVDPGDAVRVTGRVSEYYPGRKSGGGQSVTELNDAAWTVDAHHRALPAPVTLDAGSVPERYAPKGDGADGSIEKRTLEPSRYALDRFESLEGMRVRISGSRVVGPTDSYHELWVTVRPRQNPTPRGGTLYGSYGEPNSGRLKVMSLVSGARAAFPKANTGDELTGSTVGPLDYDHFGGYTLQATGLGARRDGRLKKETTRRQRRDELAVATFNVENLSPKDPQSKFDALADAIVHRLSSPDIVSLEEVQDDDGPTDDGVVTAGKTLKKLTAAVSAAGGPAYRWRGIDPANDKDGGQPGGNIRNEFLFNPKRVSFTDRPGGTATRGISVRGSRGKPRLSASPGRIAPGDAAWKSSRKPLAGEFVFHGKRVFVIGNHFDAKLGDQGLDSRFQPPARSSERQRGQQAKLVNRFVRQLRQVDPKARAVVLGDLNDFPFSPALKTLTSGGALRDLITGLPAAERYTYVYDGNSQALDHVLTTPGTGRADYDSVHVNAEFADQMSDHDPQVVRLRLR